MKKKILTVLVCAAVILTTACDNSNSNFTSTSTSSSTSTSTTSSDSSSSESSAAPESNPSESSSTTDSESSSAPESSTPENSGDNKTEGGFVHGKSEGSTYTSEFMGLKAEFGDGWVLETDDVLAQTNLISDMSDESVQKALNTNAILYEMVAANETNSNVNIVVENLTITNLGKALTAEEYIDAAIGNLASQYKVAGLDAETEKSTASFIGKEAACINVKLSGGDQTGYQKMIVINNGMYMYLITFTAMSEEDIASDMSMFTSM